jgi:ABC-type cobalamin/Fe3+-siderophores transport system ATPase subunit
MKDTFRKNYHTLRDENTQLILNIKNQLEVVEQLMRNIQNREMSLAITNLEQAAMWSTKAIVLHDARLTDDVI